MEILYKKLKTGIIHVMKEIIDQLKVFIKKMVLNLLLLKMKVKQMQWFLYIKLEEIIYNIMKELDYQD